MQIIFIILILISTGFTRILNIPIQYTSIQEGLNIAESNDTILVSPGIYIENLQWPEIEDFWNRITFPKLDVSDVGHMSGTGAVSFDSAHELSWKS